MHAKIKRGHRRERDRAILQQQEPMRGRPGGDTHAIPFLMGTNPAQKHHPNRRMPGAQAFALPRRLSPALVDDGGEQRRREHRRGVPGLRARLDAAVDAGGRLCGRRPDLAAREAAAADGLHLPLRDVARLGHFLGHVGSVSGEHGDHLGHGGPLVGGALGAVERGADDAQDLIAVVLGKLGVHEVQRMPVFVQFPHLKRIQNLRCHITVKFFFSPSERNIKLVYQHCFSTTKRNKFD